MRNQDPKAFPDPENTRAIVSGFGTQRSKPGPHLSPIPFRRRRALYTADARRFRRVVASRRETQVVTFPERHFAVAYWESGLEADGPPV